MGDEMKKLLFIIISCIFLVACSKYDSMDPVITGEIVEISKGRFFVKEVPNIENKGGLDYVWFTAEDTQSLEIGQIVSVWAEIVETSDPPKSHAEKIVIIE